nr:acetyl-CoA carboxylase biotin carboxyl carrier protein subunit [Kibdelosporangium sp. MJ126-NF4]CEL20587.1 Biotin carboxyl carrier protein of acetyl-CoA carboxylase [Kibdelosporangium sp. MJ126-NF4]CTQ89498.1 Biotin carboxyl carrier protein of acetyl-CoA carboxylase [Kibdelosporangium sp. MJ126-NF4]
MTQGLTNHLDREFDIPEPDGDRPRPVAELNQLLERMHDNALRFITRLSQQPKVIRVRAGEVSIEVEWTTEQTGTPPASAPPPVENVETPGRFLIAPAVGVFYLAPDPSSPPFVREGDSVVVGQQVGIIEAMKLMIPVQAETAGQVAEVLKGNGEPVEFGEQLFRLAPADPS